MRVVLRHLVQFVVAPEPFYESQRAGLASLIGLLVVGFVMMIFVKEEQATKPDS